MVDYRAYLVDANNGHFIGVREVEAAKIMLRYVPCSSLTVMTSSYGPPRPPNCPPHCEPNVE